MYYMTAKPTSFRIDEENLAKLNAIAKRRDISLNKAINILISTYSQSNAESKNPEPPETEAIKKELGNQRQRINILQNQVDYLVRRKKDGESRHRQAG